MQNRSRTRSRPLASLTPTRSLVALFPPVLVLAAALGTSLATSGCRVDQQEFNNRVFACNVASPDPGCGIDEDGRSMACFATRQLGATDFCAKSCDPPSPEEPPPPPSDSVCLSSSISLATCLPSQDHPKAVPPQFGCAQRGMACYRTDLLTDEGVCTTMNPCDQDTDCSDPIRSVCAATFLAELYSKAADVLQRDHMYCLQTGCRARGTSCSPGETCLQEVIPASAHPPDICVPNCDSHLKCPPNFLCYRKVSTAVTPNVCIPGLMGFTCESAIDCMVGDCVDNGLGYRVCVPTCETPSDCERFDGVQGKFMCVKNFGDPTVPGRCQTPDSYRGSLCDTTAECIPRNGDEVCSRFNPKDAQGTCLLRCDPDGKCKPRAGINHTCLPSTVAGESAGVCFPGYFGFPCASDSNCIDSLGCRPTGAEQPPAICTVTCTSTADCKANRWIEGDGWCHPQASICVPKGAEKDACVANEGCKSGKCGTDKKCAPADEEP